MPISPEHSTYVRTQLARGVSPESIKDVLRAKGWTEDALETLFREAFAPGEGSHEAAALGGVPVAAVPLASLGDLFARAWGILKKRFWVMLGVGALGLVPLMIVGAAVSAVVVMGIFGGLTNIAIASPMFLGFGALAILAALAALWMGVALLFAVRDDIAGNTVFGSYKLARNYVFPMLWIALLSILVVWGGIMLVIIPGIVAAVWLTVSRFVLVVEDARGMKALAKSKAYVSGNWWAVLLRLGALAAVTISISIAVNMVLGLISGADPSSKDMTPLQNIGDMVVSIVTSFYSVSYLYALYTSLRDARPEVRAKAEHPNGALTWFILVPLVGMAIVAALLFNGTMPQLPFTLGA